MANDNKVDLNGLTLEVGGLTVGGEAVTGGASIEGVTASAAELNVLDGIAAGLTAAELSILDGATLSTAELNKLDGVTATTAELNLLDGLPTADPNDGVTVWNDAGVLKVATPA